MIIKSHITLITCSIIKIKTIFICCSRKKFKFGQKFDMHSECTGRKTHKQPATPANVQNGQELIFSDQKRALQLRKIKLFLTKLL